MNAPSATTPRSHAARPLSAELAQLRDAFADKPATLREIVGALAGRAWELLMILFVLPFLLPVSVPGMSTPLGLAVAVIAVQLALGRLPWLPRWLLERQLPAGFLAKVLGVTQGVVKFFERALRPRLPMVTGARWLHVVHLLMIVIAALLLALPLPIPFTNTFPGWTILLFAAGLMERDGLIVLLGYVAMAATTALFYGVSEAVRHSLLMLGHWFTG